MRSLRTLALAATAASFALAQLPAPNELGVSTGHLHLIVKDPDAQKKVWMDVLGATEVTSGTLKLLKLPGMFILIQKGEPTGGSNGSTMNHDGYLVKSYEDVRKKVMAAGLKVIVDSDKNKQLIVEFPEEVRVEFNEDATISAPVVHHHTHLSVPDPEGLQAWYIKVFGATKTTRRNLPAAGIPGGEVDFLKAQMPPVPSKGRTIDHIGFEVKDLDAFAKHAKEAGVMFDMEPRDMPQLKLKISFITDPAGTRIEITQGLAGL
jgi:catechol 2,3-dioxygenase-like lactoylglutathione lyase family enzyme